MRLVCVVQEMLDEALSEIRLKGTGHVQLVYVCYVMFSSGQ